MEQFFVTHQKLGSDAERAITGECVLGLKFPAQSNQSVLSPNSNNSV
jgi:hypothetical protein